MLSAFGEMFERLVRDRGLSKRWLADLAHVSSGKLTESLRDREWASENGKRWYGPDLEKLEVWADAFGLKGAERAEFIDLAHLAHGTRHTKRRFDQLRAAVRELTERVETLEKKRR